MLQGLAKAKALKEFKALRQEKASLQGLALAKGLKRLRELRTDLGMGVKSQNTEVKEYADTIISSDLVVDETMTPKERRKAVQDWLRENLQGKTMRTSDGKNVFFNRKDSVEHLVFDSRYSLLASKAIGYIADVFKNGQFIGREALTKERKDKFIAFHIYEKQVKIDGKLVLLQAKAGEKSDGTLQTLDSLIAYHQKVKAMLDNLDNKKGHFLPYIKSMDLNGELALDVNNSIMLDSMQDDEATLTILQVLDENGNDITDDILSDETVGGESWTEKSPASTSGGDETVQPLAGNENSLANTLNNVKPSNKTPLNMNDIEPLHIDDNTKAKKAVERYLSQFKDKYITTVDGKNVVFNSKGRNHLANDVVFNENLVTKAIGKVVEVLTQGKFIEVQDLNKDRYDNFIAFHVYRKWVMIDNQELHLQIKVAELQDGTFEVGNGLIAYSAKNAENKKVATPPVSPSNDDLPINSEDYHLAEYDKLFDKLSQETSTSASNAEFEKDEKAITPPATQYDSVPMNSGAYRLFNENNIAFDKLSQETSTDYVFLEILEVRPLSTQNPRPFDRSQITIPKSKNARQNR